MKVLIINGSPRANGNTDIALREMEKVFAEESVETKRLNIGTQMIHGCQPGEAAQDAEGLQTMRTLARNMTFLMKSIALGRETFGLPEQEERVATHFIR